MEKLEALDLFESKKSKYISNEMKEKMVLEIRRREEKWKSK